VRAYVYAVFRLLLIYELRVSLLRVAKALLDKEASFKLAYLKDFGPYYKAFLDYYSAYFLCPKDYKERTPGFRVRFAYFSYTSRTIFLAI
jgi:hypothetical protein